MILWYIKLPTRYDFQTHETTFQSSLNKHLINLTLTVKYVLNFHASVTNSTQNVHK